MVLNVILSLSFRHYLRPDTLIVDRWRRNVISQTRKLRHRDHEITARQNRAKAAIKQEQSDARIESAEREQARRQNAVN